MSKKYISAAILGISVQNAELEDLVGNCLTLLTIPSTPAAIAYVTSLDTKDIVDIYGYFPNTINHPELLHILRKTNIVTLNSSLLYYLSQWLGSPIQTQILPKDLFLALAKGLGKRQKGVFLIGSADYLSKAVAVQLHETAPGLRIVGLATPHIYTQGEDLINASERDELLIEQINASTADLLVINLENAKHNIWFERIHKHLTVSLVVGVSTPLIAILKPPQTPPSKTSTVPLKSVTKKETRRLSFFELLKLCGVIVPLVIYHNINRYLFKLFYAHKPPSDISAHSLLFLSPHRTIATILLPPIIDNSNINALAMRIEEIFSHDVLVLDFRHVRHIQPEGFSLLINTWLNFKDEGKHVYGFCPSKDIIWLMRLHRVWQLFQEDMCTSADSLIAQLPLDRDITHCYDAINQQGMSVCISLLGALDNAPDFENYLTKWLPTLAQRDCILDLSYCTYIDNMGFSFLLNLQKTVHQSNHRLALRSLSPSLLKQFRNAKVDGLFTIDTHND